MSAEGPEPSGTTAETHAPDEAAERLADPADRPGPPRGPDPADSVAEGMGYLDQAIEAFSRACESADGDIMPLAIELLARTLPLRGHDADAALVWQRGLEDPDPAVETAVRTRLRRAFGGDEVPADGEGADPSAKLVSVVPGANPVPVTVTVSPPAAGPWAGDTEMTVGSSNLKWSRTEQPLFLAQYSSALVP